MPNFMAINLKQASRVYADPNNPDMHFEAFSPQIVELVDHLVDMCKEIALDEQIDLSLDEHWNVFQEVLKVYKALYPVEYFYFLRSVEKIRKDSKSTNGVGKGKGGASIQHQLEIPYGLHAMLKALFPKHTYDKKFVKQLGIRMPIFTIGN